MHLVSRDETIDRSFHVNLSSSKARDLNMSSQHSLIVSRQRLSLSKSTSVPVNQCGIQPPSHQPSPHGSIPIEEILPNSK
jgi:hypothetical protein